jgi:hypothetical protein
VDDGAASDVSRRASPKCSAIANCGFRNHDATGPTRGPDLLLIVSSIASATCAGITGGIRRRYSVDTEVVSRPSDPVSLLNKDRLRHEAKHDPMIPCE